MRHLPLFALVPIILGCGAAVIQPTPGPSGGGAAVVGVTYAVTNAPAAPTRPAATAQSVAATATRPPAATPTAAPAPAGAIGDIAQKTGVWAAATRVDNPGKVDSKFVTVAAGQKLVIVDVILGNDSDTPLSVNPLNATLVDSDGFAVRTKLGGANRQIDTITLAKGERVQGEIGFEMPANAKPALLRMTNGLFGGLTLEMGLAAPALPPKVSPLPRTRPAYAKLGATADNGGYTLSVVAFEPAPKLSRFYAATPGYKLVAAEVIVGNNKDDKMSVNPLYAHLVDTRGFVWQVELGGRDGNQLDAGDIGKGEKARGWVAFEIPVDATPDAVRMDYGNIFSPISVYAAVQ